MTGQEVKRIEGYHGIVKVVTNLALTRTGELIMLEPNYSNAANFELLS